MSENKTQPTDESVEAVIERVGDAQRREDCHALVAMMRKASGEAPVMWGARIVGFGRYRYRYASGREGEWPLIGFACGGKELTVYLMNGFDDADALLAQLGRHRTGKSCLYLKRLADIDTGVLETMLQRSLAAMDAQRLR